MSQTDVFRDIKPADAGAQRTEREIEGEYFRLRIALAERRCGGPLPASSTAARPHVIRRTSMRVPTGLEPRFLA